MLIHIHDVYLPYPFQRDVDKTFKQWMETGLLIAMLNHSTRFEIVLCQSYLHYAAPELLREVFPEYRPAPNDGGLENRPYQLADGYHFPTSTDLRVK